ncbi:MAG: nuclear transport factor 2 family protein [Betaproteobacteria bacterium]
MSKSTLSGLFLAVLVAFVPATATADSRDDIERMEQLRGQALLDADMPSLYAMYADEFFYNRARGDSLTKSEYLPLFASGDVKVNSGVREGVDIRVYGDTAVVTGTQRTSVTIKGEDRNLHLRYLHVWVKRGDVWVLVARQATNMPTQN